MRRPQPPFWLAQPSRFALVPMRTARWLLAGVVILLLATLLAVRVPAGTAGHVDGQSDVALYAGIVDGVRHGGDYYTVAADSLRAGDYPLRPFVTFRLPTLAVVEAALPDWLTLALLWTLALAVLATWYARLAPALPRLPPRAALVLLLLGGLVVFVQPSLVWFHEIWAGLLVALSLSIRRRGRWLEAVAIGLCAVLIRETAALYIGLMVAFAVAEGERREATAWAAVLGVLAVAVALHAHAVGMVVRPLDQISPGWSGMIGFGLFVRTMVLSTALSLLPLALVAPIVGLALVGWSAWRDPLALRALATLAAYALLLAVFGRSDTFYWGLLVVPMLLPGLAFAPDALRDLIGGALDRRRITVTRVVR